MSAALDTGTAMNVCLQGDCRDVMRSLIEAGVRVQCIVTSPPYWGLRDYGMPGQLGMEPTIGDFIANMVEVFDLCKELLTDDGTLWLNMGDSYAGSRSGPDSGSTLEGSRRNQNAAKAARMSMVASRRRDDAIIPRSDRKVDGLKAKDLIGQPWRLAFALQEAGWWLRQDIIWHKPNPMPESVADRCTKAHEYLFLLTKSERYHFDQRAIAEPVATSTAVRVAQEIDQQTAQSARMAEQEKNGRCGPLARPRSGTSEASGRYPLRGLPVPTLLLCLRRWSFRAYLRDRERTTSSSTPLWAQARSRTSHNNSAGAG